jgi:prepilin-type N-terminal cleavage/methylation domain-containing protein
MKQKLTNRRGFTIIEVMIVLAMAGLIMVVVFIGVPILQRTVRDSQRKNYANQVFDAAQDFYARNGRLPACDATHSSPALCPNAQQDAIRFITKYMPEGVDPETEESYRADTAQNVATSYCHGVATPSQSTVYCWDDTPSFYINHNLVPAPGQVIIAALHTCVGGQTGVSVGGFGAGTIQDQPHGYNNAIDFSVIIGLEEGKYYCVTDDSSEGRPELN